MKRWFVLFSLLPLFSCAKTNGTEKITLLHCSESSKEVLGKQESFFHRIETDKYEFLMEKKSTMLLYVLASGCQSCDTFGFLLKSYIRDTSYLVEMMPMDSFLKSQYSLSLSSTSLVFIREGKIIDYRSSFEDIGSKKELSEYLSEKVEDSHIEILNKTEENTSIESLESYRFLSEMREGQSMENSPILFIKEKNADDYSKIISYAVTNSISYLVFNQEEQEKENLYLETYVKVEYKNGEAKATPFDSLD